MMTGKIKKPTKNEKKKKKMKDGKRKVLTKDISDVVKRKPSKVELKSVIEALKKDDCGLLSLKKAVRYVPHYLKSEGLTKKLLKEVIRLWAESHEKIRVISLLCLVRVFNKLKSKEQKQNIVKKLYTTFLNKCRITKLETMSMIGFMRHSLIELYKLDKDIAAKQAQTSCQQLTVTLKNAKTHKNEETYKTVLNWQFANCLILLSGLVTAHEDNASIKSLLKQVIDLNLGAIELLFSPRYYPFYCHLIENLINLSISSVVFIPILPQILQIIDKIEVPHKDPKEVKISNGTVNGNQKKKNSKNKEFEEDEDGYGDGDNESDEDPEESSEDENINGESDDEEEEESGEDKREKKKKKYDMDLLNHVTLDEAHTLEFKLAVLDKLYDLLVRYLASQSHRIAFPELVLLPSVQLKKWVKKNHGCYSAKFKNLLDKVKMDCETSDGARHSIDFAFTNYSAVDAWERRLKDSNKLVLPKLVEQ